MLLKFLCQHAGGIVTVVGQVECWHEIGLKCRLNNLTSRVKASSLPKPKGQSSQRPGRAGTQLKCKTINSMIAVGPVTGLPRGNVEVAGLLGGYSRSIQPSPRPSFQRFADRLRPPHRRCPTTGRG